MFAVGLGVLAENITASLPEAMMVGADDEVRGKDIGRTARGDKSAGVG